MYLVGKRTPRRLGTQRSLQGWELRRKAQASKICRLRYGHPRRALVVLVASLLDHHRSQFLEFTKRLKPNLPLNGLFTPLHVILALHPTNIH